MKKVPTPDRTRCEDVAALLGLPLQRTVKAIAVVHDEAFHLLLLRGDHDLNELKTQKLSGLESVPLCDRSRDRPAPGLQARLHRTRWCAPSIRVIADRSVAAMSDFVCGANDEGFHLTGVNFGRDVPEPALVADIRNVQRGDASPDGSGTVEIVRGIEVGHIFQLRTKYSEAMKATFLDEQGKERVFEMGCYGIGVTRIVGAAIEQGHDDRGIVWPDPIAPFRVAIVPLGYRRSDAVRKHADELYRGCRPRAWKSCSTTGTSVRASSSPTWN